MIHLFDDDPRKYDADYFFCKGSFAQITDNLNIELKKRNLYASHDQADIIGFSSGIKLDFGFSHKRRFIIGVWESNQIPRYLINERARLEAQGNYQYFGLSQQVQDAWSPFYDTKTSIVNIGADTDFWRPQNIKKFDKFTILSLTSCNFRCGCQHLLQAYMSLWQENKDIQLIIKNTDERAKKLPIFIKRMQERGMNVHYICERMDARKIRELIAQCHVVSYSLNMTSGGLIVPECSAMEIPVIVGDYCPTNIYPSCEKVLVSKMSLAQFKEVVVNYWGFPYTFPEGWMDEEKAFMYWLDGNDFAQKLLKIKNDYDSYIDKAKMCRQEVIKNWTWSASCDQLLKALNV